MFSGKMTLGVVLSQSGGEAALIRARAKRTPKLLASATSKAAIASFMPLDEQGLNQVFVELTKAMPSMIRRADLPLYVSLPDPLVQEDILTFNEFPADAKEAHDLIRLRLARNGVDGMNDLVSCYQVIGEQDGAIVTRVRSMERGTRDAVEAAATRCGLHVAKMESWSAYASRALTKIGGNGAFIWSDGVSWSLTCWADAAPEGFFESGWVQSQPEAAAGRISRLLRSFSMAHETGPLTMINALPEQLARLVQADNTTPVRSSGTVLLPSGSAALQVASWG